MGLQAPTRAYTGRRFHALLAYAAINTRRHADIGQRLRDFRNRFNDEHIHDLQGLEAKLDATQDLRRVVRVYGTSKKDVGIISRFYGQNRVEDEALREHLLSLTTREPGQSSGHASTDGRSGLELKTATELPRWFVQLLEGERELKDLWAGKGKPSYTDQSRSGFDYSVVRRLLRLGYRDIDELATILSLRPGGAAPERAQGM